MAYLGYILLTLGILIVLFAVIITIIKALTDDVKGIKLVFAIFFYRPWLVLGIIGAILITAGQLIL